MTKRRRTRRALINSIISLIICFSMLLGTTFAWFTDSVVSSNNLIVAGNLDVELYHSDKDESNTRITNDVKDLLFDDVALWEPGAVAYENFVVANEGTLALKYQMAVNFTNENHVGEYGLSDILKVAVVESAINMDTANADARKALIDGITEWKTMSDFVVDGKLLPKESTVVAGLDDTDTYGIVIYWEPTANDNNWNVNNDRKVDDIDITNINQLHIDLGVNLFATQLVAENDSFGPDYDKDAWNEEMLVFTKEDLDAALNAGKNITLGADLKLEKTLTIPDDTVVEMNLNGKTISADIDKKNGHVIKNEGTLTIVGGTVSSTANNGGSAIMNNGTLKIEGTTLNGAPNADGSWPSYTVNNTGTMTINNAKITSHHGAVASYNEGAVVILNNTDIDMTGIPGFTSHGIYTYNNGKAEVNGGNIANKATDQNASGASVINGAVTVNSGNFTGRIENYYGTPVIKGGTFSVKPTNFVAAGYTVTGNDDGTWTVGAHKVSTGTALVAAVKEGKAVELTQDIAIGKIDLTDAITNDVVIDANGHKITTTDSYGIEVTAGKNITISDADVEMTKNGDYITYAAGLKIANGDYAGSTITLENCTIKMANTDWAYAVNMPASVKNLNLVIDNCTLEGAIAVQCWGDNNTVTITNSKLICNYTTSALYTSYCVVLQSDGTNVAENNTFVIDNCEFQYSGIDNFNSIIKAADDLGTSNKVIVTNCTYGEKVSSN